MYEEMAVVVVVVVVVVIVVGWRDDGWRDGPFLLSAWPDLTPPDGTDTFFEEKWPLPGEKRLGGGGRTT